MRIVVDDVLALMREQGHSNGLHVDGNVMRVVALRIDGPALAHSTCSNRWTISEDGGLGVENDSQSCGTTWRTFGMHEDRRASRPSWWGLVAVPRLRAWRSLRSTWGARAVELQGSGRLHARACSVCWSEGYEGQERMVARDVPRLNAGVGHQGQRERPLRSGASAGDISWSSATDLAKLP